PKVPAGNVARRRLQRDVIFDPPPLDFLELFDLRRIDPLFIHNDAVRIAHRDHTATELNGFLCRVDGDVARTGNQHAFAVKTIIARLQHLFDEVDAAVTGGFLADLAATEIEPFAGQDPSFELVG